MTSCCEQKACDLASLRQKQAGVLKIVLAINGIMFLVEMTSGILWRSTSLLADSLDMFGDAVVYAFTLFVLNRSERWRAGAALLKGGIMVAFGLAVLAEAFFKVGHDILPVGLGISGMGVVALAANTVCLVLLMRHKNDDINMRSTWVCSRNDIVANVGVIGAGGLVLMFQSKWPDVVVGLCVASVFLISAFGVLKEAWGVWKPRSALA